jgi:hypothetical protein
VANDVPPRFATEGQFGLFCRYENKKSRHPCGEWRLWNSEADGARTRNHRIDRRLRNQAVFSVFPLICSIISLGNPFAILHFDLHLLPRICGNSGGDPSQKR